MLIGTELVRELVESVILTGKVQNSEPVSLLLIASPESGKTSIVLQKMCKSAVDFTDITGRGIQEFCKGNPEMTHIILNDMVAILSHKPTVNRFTLSQLNAMTEEGIRATGYPGSVDKYENGKRGVIACLTLDLARDGRAWWNKIGFSTRMMPFAYHYPYEMQVEIKNSICNSAMETTRRNEKKKPEFKVPSKPVRVGLSKRQTESVRIMADARAKVLKETGFRRLHQYLSLVKGHALWRTWKKPVVNDADIAFLRCVDPHVLYDETLPLPPPPSGR